MQRRSFVAGLGATLWMPTAAHAQVPLADNPFRLGVASGRPTADSVVLWTRLMARESFERPSEAIAVRWWLAEDERMQRVVRSGQATATPQWAHSIHVEVAGLAPNRPYWYRFAVRGAESPVGRTRTMAAPDEKLQSLRFAFASCQQYEQGWFSALRHMAGEDIEAVVHLGDYIYELSWGRELVRRHEVGRPTTLEEYRDRYALYKADPDLQAAHAAHPWIVTWDDHEVDNDYTGDISPLVKEPARFLRQRAAAYQAYWEHMPLPVALRPQGPALRLHDRLRIGDLAEFHVIDARQYREHHACLATLGHGKLITDCSERLDPRRSMLGFDQETWLGEGLRRASTRWNVIAQQTLMAEIDRGRAGKTSYWADGWDGYAPARRRLLDQVAASPVRDTLVLGGDVHSFWATDLTREGSQTGQPVIAAEFVGGSLTSQGPTDARLKTLLARNPHVRYGKTDVNGYALVALSPKTAEVTFRTVRTVKEKDSPLSTLARFVVEAGRPGVQKA